MTSERPGAVPKQDLRVTDPALIPSGRFYDEGFFREECEKLWPHVWQMACRLEEIPEVGDYVEYTLLQWSVIIVRTREGVKAFHNACRHRGVQLVGEPGNCRTSGFICPFHGWRFDMDGRNTFVFGRKIFDPALLEQDSINLVPCRVEMWAGCAFINFDNDAPSLQQCLGPVEQRMNIRNADQLKMEWWYGTVLPTNWKLAMEAFMEGYHVMRTHPQLHALAPRNKYEPGSAGAPQRTPREMVEMMAAFLERLGDGMAGLVHSSEIAIARSLVDMDLPDDPALALGAYVKAVKTEITRQGQAQGLPMPDLVAVDAELPHRGVEFIFPHMFLLQYFGAMSQYRIRPLTAETCLFEIWSLAFLPDDDSRERPRAPTMLPYDSLEFPEIPQQDYANLPRQQRGLHAIGFDHMRLSGEVEGMVSNYQRLIDGFLDGVASDLLAKAQAITNDGFDRPILDLGL